MLTLYAKACDLFTSRSFRAYENMLAEPGRVICEILICLGKLNTPAFIEVLNEGRKEGRNEVEEKSLK